MKKVINVGIGGRGYVLDVDAYDKLNSYLEQFESKLGMGSNQAKDVMDDLEARIAVFFSQELASCNKDVVDSSLVDMAISQFGMPDGSRFHYNANAGQGYNFYVQNGIRKFYRDIQNKSIGGVCSGLAIYLGLDIALVRVLFVVCFFMGTASFWLYIILWIVAPPAVTPAQKCEQHGLPLTAENLNMFSDNKNR